MELPQKKAIKGHLTESLSLLMICQIELGLEAVKKKEPELASLMGRQLFDVLDWCRLNCNKQAMEKLESDARRNIKKSSLRIDDLQQLENYAEAHFFDHISA